MQKKHTTWPKDCVWPEPLKEGEGEQWEADDAEGMPLDDAAQELFDVKEFFDDAVSVGRLNDDYTLNTEWEIPDEDPWVPDMGEDYWDEDHFDYDFWLEDLTDRMNLLKIPAVWDPVELRIIADPAAEVQQIIDYNFINENILRQAFTRRAFSIEYGTGNSELLELIGDTVLNTVIMREMARQVTRVDNIYPCKPFISSYSEGDLSKIRSRFVSKEYLSSRAMALGLDKYILYGSGEEKSDSSREDMMEAVLGAVAVDSGWDWYTLEAVVDRLINFHISSDLLRPSCYDILNSWHQKHFGCMPSYEMSKGMPVKGGSALYEYHCILRYQVPENDKGVRTSQRVDVQRETRSKARERAAEEAVSFLRDKGLWVRLEDAGIEPRLEDSINQLQELYQKKYIEKPVYDFKERPDEWYAKCRVNAIEGWGNAKNKTAAKKKAAFMVLVRLMMAAGISNPELEKAMWNTLEG